MQRTFPHWDYAPDAYDKAYAAAEDLARLSKTGRAMGVWELAGPTNIGGRITDIEFDPLNPNVVYAGAATGGVFKSTDTGNTWTPIFDGYAVANVGDIGIAPSDPSTLYLGTGEANGLFNNLQGAGVFKSIDGGSTWQNVGLEETAAIGRIVVHPENPDLVYVAAVGSYFDVDTNRGVFRSSNGGADWEQVLFLSDSTGAVDLVINPRHPDTLYAAMWHRLRRPTFAELEGRTSGIYLSTDGGDTWTELGPSAGLPDPETEDVGRIGLAISHSNPNIVYTTYTDGFRFSGIYKTTDGGGTWTNFDPDSTVERTLFQSSFSWFFGQVRVSPFDPDRVYLMEVELVQTHDGGDTWSVQTGSQNLHVDHHAMAFHPANPDYVIIGNDGGLNISENGGRRWRKIRGLPITQFYEIEIDPLFPEQIYGGTQDNQTVFTSTGGADDWETIDLSTSIFGGGDGFHVEVTYEPAGYKAIYVESQWGNLYKSFAGGDFQALSRNVAAGERRNWSTPYLFAPGSVSTLYYGAESLHKSETRGTTWKRISPKLTDDWPTNRNLGTISTIDIAPSLPQAIIIGTDDGHVWMTSNEGADWQEVSAQLPLRWVTRARFDPKDANVAYVTFSGLQWRDPQPHVFRTDDFGETWIDVSGNLPDAPVNAFEVDPVEPRVIYVGTDVGAFVHFDRGSGSGGWETLGEDLPAVAVYDLQVNREPHFIAAGTHGRSMYRLDLSGLVTAVEPDPAGVAGSAFELDGNYPNPFSTSTTIRFRLEQSRDISVEVFDLSGRLVTTLYEGAAPAGLQAFEWDGRSENGTAVSSGTYLFRVSSSDGSFSETAAMSRIR